MGASAAKPHPDTTHLLKAASVDGETIGRIAGNAPRAGASFEADREAFSAYWAEADALANRLHEKGGADDTARRAREAVETEARGARKRFLERHAEALYRRLTDDLSKAKRVESLVADAASAVPGLVPDGRRMKEEAARELAGKRGYERDQGQFLGAILNIPEAGHHLCATMLMPRPESLEALPRLAADGEVDLGLASVERRGGTSIVTLRHPRTLNAEDEGTLAPFETAVDLAILDPETEICVLRGGPVDAARYPAGRVFSSGINLTDLYLGRVSYLFYLVRDMGLVNKIYRGLLDGAAGRPGQEPETREKLWIGVVESFAIGGGCQLVLVMDHVIAESNAYFTLPARKEGIIPGLANLRLPQYVGRKLAAQAIFAERRIDCDSPEGRMICDEVVPLGAIDATLEKAVARLTGSGLVSAAGNRKAIRINLEPLDAFRRYMAVFAPEQAECHLSPALVRNLEAHWNARRSKPSL